MVKHIILWQLKDELQGEEKLVADNFAFRTGAVEINNIGDLIMATEVGVDGNFWVENLTLSE